MAMALEVPKNHPGYGKALIDTIWDENDDLVEDDSTFYGDIMGDFEITYAGKPTSGKFVVGFSCDYSPHIQPYRTDNSPGAEYVTIEKVEESIKSFIDRMIKQGYKEE
jgi:hypothetical protein